MLRTDYILKLKLMLAIVSAVLCVRSSFALGYSCFADISNVDAQVSFATYYDANCNITAISRGGMETEVNGTRIDIDDLTLSYSGNQLMQVTDSGEDSGEYGVMEFIDHSNVANEYAYDANGNMTRDLNKGIANITYNLLNLPGEITFSDGRKVKYIYTADGAKVRTTYFDTTGSQTLQVDYCGNYILRNGVVDRILTPSGYIKNDTVYSYVKDYQGNIRSIVRQDGAVVESTDYYPYGNPFTTAGAVQPNKYGSKELDRMHGLDLYDSEARWYDSLLGRTTTMDPLAEKYYSLSPYLWCAGNPVRFVDPDGRIIKMPANSTAEQVFSVLGNLQALTDDKLVFSTQKDGSIRIKIASLGRGSKSSGTRLIRRLNRSSKVMSINVGLGQNNYEEDVNSKNAINGIGTDVMVNFDSNSDPDIGTINSKNGRVVPKKRPPFIGLVHELIHGYRSMSGSAINL